MDGGDGGEREKREGEERGVKRGTEKVEGTGEKERRGEGRGREGEGRRDDAAGEIKAHMTCLIPCCSLPHSPASACLQASHH